MNITTTPSGASQSGRDQSVSLVRQIIVNNITNGWSNVGLCLGG